MRGLQRIAAGQKFRPSERTWNAMAASAERSQGLDRGPRGDSLPLVYLGDRVIVRNTTEGNWAAGTVVELSDFLPALVENEKLWFDAIEVTDLGAVHAILRDGILQNDFGEAQLVGAVRAKVNVNDAGHEYAYVKPTATELESAPIGPIRLLHVPGTGSQLCVVLLPAADEGVLTGELTADLDQGASAAVDELDLDATNAKVYTGRTFTVWDLKLNSGESIAQGTIIDFVRMSRGRYKWIAAHCDVSDTLPGA